MQNFNSVTYTAFKNELCDDLTIRQRNEANKVSSDERNPNKNYEGAKSKAIFAIIKNNRCFAAELKSVRKKWKSTKI